MNQLEKNLMESFKKVKEDMHSMNHAIARISENQERIMSWLQDTREKEIMLYQKVMDIKEQLNNKNK